MSLRAAERPEAGQHYAIVLKRYCVSFLEIADGFLTGNGDFPERINEKLATAV